MASPGKKMLANAMKETMNKKPLRKVSVGDIVDACGLNRNSFYYHFKDKYDLVNWIFYNEFVVSISYQDYAKPWDFVEHVCRFFYENRKFYANALSDSGQNSFTEYFSEIMRSVIMIRLDEIFEEQRDKEFCAVFFVEAFLASLTKWLNGDEDVQPEEFSRLIQRSVEGIAAF